MLPKCSCVWKTLRFEDKPSLSPVCYAHSQPSPCEPLLTWYLLTDSNFAHCEPKPAYSDISCIQTCWSMHCLWSFSLCAGLGNKCLCPSLHLKNWLCYRTKTSQLTVCLYAYNGTIYAPQPALPTTIALEALFSDLHPEDCFAPQPVTSKTVASVHPWAYYSTCSSSPGQTG